MDKLYFYKVDKNYTDYLYDYEIRERGFSRVPRFDYVPPEKEKFVCGIMLNICNLHYLAPISSYKLKQPNNIILYDKNGNPLSSIRLNYMFPAISGCYSYFDFNSEVDKKYISVVHNEWVSVNNQRKAVISLALSTYQTVCALKNNGQEFNWACDFPLLEAAANNYKKI